MTTIGRSSASSAAGPAARVDAGGALTKELNVKLRELAADNVSNVELLNVCGQRYIGTDLNRQIQIDIFGTPGNDLGAFMNGPRIIVHGNAQDGCGNTMNEGEIIVHGHAGDVLGMAARGGKIFVRDYVGYRACIHMKEYEEKKPLVVIGGTAQDFAGEYMAGGVLVLLGLNLKVGELHKAKYVGVGMHGGVIYLRGNVEPYQLGPEVGVAELDEADGHVLSKAVGEFAAHFGVKAGDIMERKFIKLYPKFLRPYGRLYAY
jgi:glutamate synthase domain-containing protein 3